MVPEPPVTPQQLEMRLSRLRTQRSHITELLGSKGWEAYATALTASKDRLVKSLGEEVNPNLIMRMVGAIAQLDLNALWPELQVKLFDAQIKNEEAWLKNARSREEGR